MRKCVFPRGGPERHHRSPIQEETLLEVDRVVAGQRPEECRSEIGPEAFVFVSRGGEHSSPSHSGIEGVQISIVPQHPAQRDEIVHSPVCANKAKGS